MLLDVCDDGSTTTGTSKMPPGCITRGLAVKIAAPANSAAALYDQGLPPVHKGNCEQRPHHCWLLDNVRAVHVVPLGDVAATVVDVPPPPATAMNCEPSHVTADQC